MKVKKENDSIDTRFKTIVKTILENKNNDAFYHKLDFNTSQLKDPKFNGTTYTVFPNSEGELASMFSNLNTIYNNHCLYWFELENEQKAREINNLLDIYRESKQKKVPAHNNNANSKILYVGIRQGGSRKKDGLTNIVGRINQHLGYYHNKNTQGLQLYHYLKGKDYKITIKVIEFEGLEKHYLNIIEKMIATDLKPLCGRH